MLWHKRQFLIMKRHNKFIGIIQCSAERNFHLPVIIRLSYIVRSAGSIASSRCMPCSQDSAAAELTVKWGARKAGILAGPGIICIKRRRTCFIGKLIFSRQIHLSAFGENCVLCIYKCILDQLAAVKAYFIYKLQCRTIGIRVGISAVVKPYS